MEFYIILAAIFFFVIGTIYLLYMLIKFLKVYFKFTDYLFKVDDKTTLQKIGRINSLGQKCLTNVPFIFVIKALRDKYAETNDENYYVFTKLYIKFLKHLSFLITLLFIITIVFINVFYSVSP